MSLKISQTPKAGQPVQRNGASSQTARTDTVVIEKSTTKQESPPPKNQKPPSRLRTYASRGVRSLKLLASFLLGGFVSWNTPGCWKVFDNVAEVADLTPGQNITNSAPQQNSNYPLLFRNLNRFKEVPAALRAANITLEDRNNDGKLLSSHDEVYQAMLALDKANTGQFTEQVETLREISILKAIAHGNSDPRTVRQRDANCEVMAAALSLYLSNNTDVLEVTQADLQSNAFSLKGNLHIHGSTYPFDFNQLVHSRGTFLSGSTDRTVLAPAIINAIEQEVRSYQGVRSWFPGGAFTVATNEDYAQVPISSLNQSDLERILSLAPNTPIALTSWAETRDIFQSIDEMLVSGEPRPTHSPKKSQEFRDDIVQHAKETGAFIDQMLISHPSPKEEETNPTTTPVNSEVQTPNTVTPKQASKQGRQQYTEPTLTDRKNLSRNHVFIVKDTIYKDGKLTSIVIMDAHGVEARLPIDDLRMFGIVAPEKHLPNFNFHMLLLGAAGVLTLNGRKIYKAVSKKIRNQKTAAA